MKKTSAKKAKKSVAKKKTSAPKRLAKKRAAKPKTKTVKKPSAFFSAPLRGARGVKRTQFHVLLTVEERKKLHTLSKLRKVNAADVLRQLIASVSK